MTNSVLPELNNPLLKFLNAVSPEFQQGRIRRQEFEQGSRLKDLALQEREFGLQQSRQQAAQQQEQAQKLQLQQQAKAASEQEVEQVRIGGQLAETLKQIPDIQQRQRVLEQSLPILQSKGFDDDDIQALFDPDPQLWEQKLDDAILGSKAFTEAREEVLKAGESIVRDGQIQLTAPFKPEKPSKIESQLLAEGFQMGTPEAQARAREIGDKAGIKINLGEEKQKKKDARTFNAFETAFTNLSESLAGTTTGPILGLLPAITSSGQIAEGAISAMAPILKQIFRTAGEGTFTDKDQELLLKMIPTRTDTPDAREAKINNIDAIVKAKLGMVDEPEVEQDVDPELLEFMTPEERALFNGS